jgi:UDP-galactopyranose mutase
VTARVPVLVSYDTRYFQDAYQAMPKEGYTALFRRMLRHPNIKVLLGADWREVEGEVRYRYLIYTGPIDEFFGYAHGPLPYRSLRFRLEGRPVPWAQEVGTVNYPVIRRWDSRGLVLWARAA